MPKSISEAALEYYKLLSAEQKNFFQSHYQRLGADWETEYPLSQDFTSCSRQIAPPISDHYRWTQLELAIQRLHQALQNKEKIVIVGDFDVDGACASAILVRGLRAITTVETIIPQRHTEGYGLTVALTERIPQDASLIITVDNGITSSAAVEKLKERHQEVIITDHHIPGDSIPLATAVVNPNLPDCEFPHPHLCGAAVAWYLLWGLLGRFPEWKDQIPLRSLLPLAALATVADVVPLDKNNRFIVRAGIALLKNGIGPIGIFALLERHNKNLDYLAAEDFGFRVGPMINAVGRLEDMSIGLKLLTTDSESEAEQISYYLLETNNKRKMVEKETVSQVQELVATDWKFADTETPMDAVVFYQPHWNEGVVGLVAGRIKEQLNKPTFVFTATQQGDIKGSGRSIPGVHLRDSLVWIDAHFPGCIKRFGGHAMAAGLTLANEEQLAIFTSALSSCPLITAPKQTETIAPYDFDAEIMDFNFAKILGYSGPWGSGFVEPLFQGEFAVLRFSLVGGGHWKMKLRFLEDNKDYDAIYFIPPFNPPTFTPGAGDQVLASFRCNINFFRDNETLQLLVNNIKML